jgi:hypothetical protein
VIPFINERIAMELLNRKCTEVFYLEKYQLPSPKNLICLKLILNLNQPVEKVQQVDLFK